MKITHLISKQLMLDIQDMEKVNTICAICNNEINYGVKSKKVISGNFTNYEYFKNTSQYICVDCYKCLKSDILRKNNFIIDKNRLVLFKQKEIEKYIFNLDQFEVPFGIAITRSFKKHNSFRTKLNYDYKNVLIREEEREYFFNIEDMKKLYNILNNAYLYFNKEELLTGNYKISNIERYGLDKFLKLDTLLKKHRRTSQFEILIYMMNSEKRNEYINNKKEEIRRCKAEKKQENMQLPLF